jgi:hypothetical protein
MIADGNIGFFFACRLDIYVAMALMALRWNIIIFSKSWQ